MSLGELARQVEEQPDLIEHDPPHPVNGTSIEGLAAWRDFSPSAPTFSSGAHVAIVEVETETGEVHVLNYVAVDDIKVNGALTLGENVADLGGLKLAHAAMQAWAEKNPQGLGDYRFTPSQQFFLGFAQSWCSKWRPERARVAAQTDPHSPPFLRVNGPLSNLESFRKAFNCPATGKMFRPAAETCQVW